MAISDTEKLDLLWKKMGFGVTKTAPSTSKSGSNETIASPVIVSADSIWTDSAAVPTTPPGSTTEYVKLYTGANRLRCTADPTAPSNQTWLATTTYNTLASQIGRFIPTTFGSGYLVKVYIGDPNGGPAARIYPDTTSEEYYFDYTAGTLTFFNNIPASKTATVGSGSVTVASNGIYIEVYQYAGSTGAKSTKAYVVDDIDARDALSPNEGDTVYVKDASGIPTDASSGEWATYMYVNDAWVVTGTQDAARSDSRTSSLTITSSSEGPISLGKIGNGARVVEVSVEVTSDFDGDFALSVGDETINGRLMGEDQNDLQESGGYVTTPIYQYPTGNETEIFVYLTGTATQGSANVIITYA